MATSLLKDADSAVSANDRAFITEARAIDLASQQRS